MGKLSRLLEGIEEANKKLDMSKDARMARAKEQGFDTDTTFYHGTDSDIKAFDPTQAGRSTYSESASRGTWLTDDPQITAQSYANYAATDAKVAKKLREADEAANSGDWDLHDKLQIEAEEMESAFYDNRLQGQNILPLKTKGELKKMDAKGESFHYAEDDINKFIQQAKKEGYAGVEIENLDDAVGRVDTPSTHRMIFDPSNIRSINAAFDPAKKDSSNLLAEGAAGIAAASAIPSYKEADETESMAMEFVERRARKPSTARRAQREAAREAERQADAQRAEAQRQADLLAERLMKADMSIDTIRAPEIPAFAAAADYIGKYNRALRGSPAEYIIGLNSVEDYLRKAGYGNADWFDRTMAVAEGGEVLAAPAVGLKGLKSVTP